jgi:hypothetical protein
VSLGQFPEIFKDPWSWNHYIPSNIENHQPSNISHHRRPESSTTAMETSNTRKRLFYTIVSNHESSTYTLKVEAASSSRSTRLCDITYSLIYLLLAGMCFNRWAAVQP